MPANPNKTRCQQPNCRAWAIRGSDPPLCSAHAGRSLGAGAPPGNQNARTHGFYASAITRDELADILTHAADTTLDSEIAITRIALRRVFTMLLSGTTPGPDPRPLDAQDYARLISLAFQGSSTISRLLRAKSALPDDPNAPPSFLDQVLDELSVEWGVEL